MTVFLVSLLRVKECPDLERGGATAAFLFVMAIESGRLAPPLAKLPPPAYFSSPSRAFGETRKLHNFGAT
jgi:hypothetical protein